ncbi:GNAT family N-acetyltransferase [Aequorivita antarctica]|uniref:GNAT family N-acetyltransferase n=1 Tax=Aequorivita antarctica TaxID=153266 RepID=A0A5C6Z000_9FLAO|nr:GNAT family N-acetyltransferase [Aequorivita antarctica]TXD73259.1 GNAT family N-acetyltransferase [Aequorivita antarctica]SRX76012.1 hypothetical protein AEQU3_03010 [Aequorivita antarctica]
MSSSFEIREITFGEFLITNDEKKMDLSSIHDFLSKHSGWSDNIPLEIVRKSIENSLNFGLFHKDIQIGYARVISDFSTIAYLGDVYILEDYRKNGLSKKMMDTILEHPNLQGLRRWILLTSSANWLYEKYGFTNLQNPQIYMEKYVPYIYENK